MLFFVMGRRFLLCVNHKVRPPLFYSFSKDV
nr:MAG TPA: hypothetical protein [Caudoviricetes sp.]